MLESLFKKVVFRSATLLKRDSNTMEAWNFIEKETPVQVFSCEFGEIFRNIFFTDLLRTTASIVVIHSNMRKSKANILPFTLSDFFVILFLFQGHYHFLRAAEKWSGPM